MRKLILAIFIIFLLTTCVYYNTFFNAEEYFKSAQEEKIQAGDKPSRNADQNYNKAMKKCGIILTDYPKSKWADDALFMLSQCLFYKQKYVQAKEKFAEVILYYPTTEFAQRSHIYIARCERELNKETAYKKLRDYIVTGTSKKYLVEAMNLLAEYYLEDENFAQAEYYYQKIIDNYPKADIYEDAFFSLGILYHKNKNYELSNKIFNDFLKIKTEKKKKLDARYYIIYNHLLAGDYQTALDKISNLMRQEYRDTELTALLILKARALAKAGDTEQADIIFDQVIKENDKTALAAESSYWRAEMQFRILNNYELAIEYFNNVRTQFANSPYVEEAVSHSAVASQIVQYNSSRADIELRQLISEQMKLAEYYLEVLILPDSAMAVYDHIISYRDTIFAKLDSLQLEFSFLEAQIPQDTISVIIDSLIITDDSLFTEEDSLLIVLQDSTVIEKKPEIILPTRQDTIRENISKFQSEIELYDIEFIPYVKFVQLWLLKNIYQDSVRAEKFYNDFILEYPDNKYSNAAKMMMMGEDVEFITYKDKKQREDLEYALSIIEFKPDSARVILENIASDSTALFYKNAVYSLGYMYYYVQSDTSSARPYFEEVISWKEVNDWSKSVNLLYSDGKFQQLDRLPYLVEREEKLREEAEKLEEETLQDSTDNEMIIELEDLDNPVPGEHAAPADERTPYPKTP